MAVPKTRSQRTVVTVNGLDELISGLTALQREHYPAAMRSAINKSVDNLLDAEKRQMHKDFISPTTFTINSLRPLYASKTNLSGGVRFKDPTRLSDDQHYLYPNVYGVRRGYKPFEGALYRKGILPAGHFALPASGAPRDGYGNVPASLINQILSWFEAHRDKGTRSNMTDATRAKRKAGTKKTYGFQYFALRKANGSMPAGIYRRTYTGFGASTDLIFLFIPANRVNYDRLYRFHEVGTGFFKEDFKDVFGKELETFIKLGLK